MSCDAPGREDYALRSGRQFGHIGRAKCGRDEHPIGRGARSTLHICGGAPADAADVVGSLCEHRVGESRELERGLFRRLGQCFGWPEARIDDQHLYAGDQLRVHGHQNSCFDDVGLFAAALPPQGRSNVFEVGRDSVQGIARSDRLSLRVGAARHTRGAGTVEHDRGPDRDARGGAHPLEGLFAHLLGRPGRPLQCTEDQRRRRRAWILVANRTLAEIRRASFARLERDGRAHA